MGSIGIPKTRIQHMNTKDCSQGLCSLHCPQRCYIIFPPPSPPIEFPDDDSGPTFSPLVVAVIGILASAFLLVTYYAMISKYCGNTDSSSRRRENHDPNEDLEENDNPSNHEPWNVATTGLDEALIKSITVYKYKKGDRLIEGTDCSVCLSEFQEDESLRLLPKCSHAFHVKCIDTWLKSHSNCPLCRANVIIVNASPPLPLSPVTESPPSNESLSGSHVDIESNGNSGVAEDREMGAREEEILQSNVVSKTPLRSLSDLGGLEKRHTIIEIRDEDDHHIRRSVSMDYLCQSQVSIPIVCLKQNQDSQQ